MGVSLVNFEFGGDASKAAAELRKLAEMNRALEQAMNRMARASQSTAKGINNVLKEQHGRVKDLVDQNERLRVKIREVTEKTKEHGAAATQSFSSIQKLLGPAAIAGALGKIISLQRDYTKSIAQAAIEQDKLAKKIQVQGLMADSEFQVALKKSIAPIARRYAKSLPETQAVVTELLNQGVDKKAATSDVLEEILAAVAATGSEDATSVAQGVVGFLRASGKDITAKNVRGLTAPLAGLFKDRPIQSADIHSLASIGALMSEFGVNQSEAFGAFTVLRNQGNQDAAKATTALRNITTLLATAKTSEKKVRALEHIGGTGFAEEIDLVGESLPQAIANLMSAVNARPKEDRAGILDTIFGQEVIAQASSLFSPQGIAAMLANQQAQAGGEDALRAGVQIATSGAAAAKQRLAIDLQMAELARSERALKSTLIEDAVRVNLTRSDAPDFVVGGLDWANDMTGGVPYAVGSLRDPNMIRAQIQGATTATPIAAIRSDTIAPTTVKERRFKGTAGPVPFYEPPKRKSPEDLALEEKGMELENARIAADRARYEADEDGHLSRAEKERIHALDRVVKGLELVLGEMKNQKTERALQGEQDKGAAIPDVNRAANQ